MKTEFLGHKKLTPVLEVILTVKPFRFKVELRSAFVFVQTKK